MTQPSRNDKFCTFVTFKSYLTRPDCLEKEEERKPKRTVFEDLTNIRPSILGVPWAFLFMNAFDLSFSYK